MLMQARPMACTCRRGRGACLDTMLQGCIAAGRGAERRSPGTHATSRPQRSLAEIGLQKKLASAPDCELSAVQSL